MTCDYCRGRGWTRDGDWPVACLICRGRGRLTLFRVARVIGVETLDAYRVARMEAGPRVARRVFDAFVASALARVLQ